MEKKFYWLYVTVFVNIIGIGMIFPILPLFARTFKATSFEVGLLTATLALVQFLTAPLIGRMSDKYGRKPILLFSIAINTLSFLVTGLSTSLPTVFIGMALQGLGTAGILPAALAYVADVTHGHQRSTYISRVTGTFALGFMIGPAIGGLLGNTSLSLPFFAAFFVGILNLIIIKFFLHETNVNPQKEISIKGGLINIKPMFHAIKGQFAILFFLMFVWAFYVANFSITLPFYTQDIFGFKAIHNGLLFSTTGFTAAFTQWVLISKIEKKFGDIKTIFMGILILLIGLFLTPFAPTVSLFIVLTVINVIGSALLRPSINSLLSKRTTEGQGQIMGLAFSFESLGRVIGPIVIGISIVQFGLRLPFFITAALVLVGLILFVKKEMRKS